MDCIGASKNITKSKVQMIEKKFFTINRYGFCAFMPNVVYGTK